MCVRVCLCACVSVTIIAIRANHNKYRTSCYCEFAKSVHLGASATEQHAAKRLIRLRKTMHSLVIMLLALLCKFSNEPGPLQVIGPINPTVCMELTDEVIKLS